MRAKFISMDLAKDFLGIPEGSSTNQREREAFLFLLEVGLHTQLTPRQKECVLLYYYQGLTMKQTGEQLGITESAASRHLKKARVRLRVFLELAGQVQRKRK